MIVGVPKETFPGEARVAMVPAAIAPLTKKGIEVLVEPGAGETAGYPDSHYEESGAKIAGSRIDVFGAADVIFQVRGLGSNPKAGKADLEMLREGQILIAATEPLTAKKENKALAKTGASVFALELVPRITRAQTMDILSSQANLAGYKAVLLAADHIAKIFPMMMTAAGTIKPANVFIVGAGVAGLQAIATAKRLGAKVNAYDVRPAVKEQVESLGAKFVEIELDTAQAEDSGGYAKEQGEEFLAKQREMMAKIIAESDVVITTAAIPGRKAPILVTKEMVEGMAPGTVIVDLAAATGGNCELTKPGKNEEHGGVTIIGPDNLPSQVAQNASQVYARNASAFLLNMVDKEGNLAIDPEDEVVRDTLITQGGEIVNARVREAMGLEPLEGEVPAEKTDTEEGDES